jgi:hypothetical protein
MDLLPAGPKLREAKQITWPESRFTMSLVGFEHVFTNAQPVEFAPDLMLKVISPTALMLLKIVAFMDDPQRRVKDLDDIRGLLTQYEADSERVFSDIVIDAGLADFGLVPAFLLEIDLRPLCTPEEGGIVNAFLAAMNENNAAWMSFVRAKRRGRSPRRRRRRLTPSEKGLTRLAVCLAGCERQIMRACFRFAFEPCTSLSLIMRCQTAGTKACWGSPGSCACCSSACAGPQTTQCVATVLPSSYSE